MIQQELEAEGTSKTL